MYFNIIILRLTSSV